MAMADSRLLEVYRVATGLAHPLARPLIFWRVRRGKEDADRVDERFGVASLDRPAGPLVWVHAASVGETVSVLPLVEQMVARCAISVLLTTGTVTSARIVAKRAMPGVLHQYAPLDGRRFVRRFLAHWRPGLAIFAESELWPNMILETAARGTALALVNARMSERSFGRWRWRGAAMARHLLARFDLCLAQSETDAARLSALGAGHVHTAGNLKFDVPPPPAPETELHALSAAIAERPRWLAASLHPGEDAMVIEAHRTLAARHPGLITLLAPRHPERGSEIAGRAAAAGLRAARRSVERQPLKDSDIFILDSIGELGLAFRLAPVAFMGGSLVPHGGQNPIEPAKLDAAILHGPYVANFADIYGALDGAGCAECVPDAGALAAAVGGLLGAPAEAERRRRATALVLDRFSGALKRTLSQLEPMLAELAGQK